jgi:uncharacterized cysteine cluster protein YcgN (CxxCxxCC family)
MPQDLSVFLTSQNLAMLQLLPANCPYYQVEKLAVHC